MPRQKKRIKIIKRIAPALPGGFRDYGPREAIERAGMIGAIRETFERFGFEPMETPAVERTEILTAGEKEFGKIIYHVRGSKDLPAGKAGEKSDLSLRFDLTVPLARFIAANPDIPKPFKRYQIGTAWRGESPQAGRYREFLQADADIAGSSSLEADAEIIALSYQTLKNLGVDDFIIRLNSRKILNGLPSLFGFREEKLPELLRIIDKKEKIGMAAVQKEVEKLFDRNTAEKISAFLEKSEERKNVYENEFVREGRSDLETIISILSARGIDTKKYIVRDFAVVRGLGYYTGMVFEMVFPSLLEIGSIISGGRYDGLTLPFSGYKTPCVGASIGIDRLFAALEKTGFKNPARSTMQVLILDISPACKNEYYRFAEELRGAGQNTSLYLGDDKTFQAQLAYAVKKEIPFILIYGEEEKKKGVVKIKNLASREQKEMPKNEIASFFKKNEKAVSP